MTTTQLALESAAVIAAGALARPAGKFLLLALQKGLVEPLAGWWFRVAYRWLDARCGGRLPDWLGRQQGER